MDPMLKLKKLEFVSLPKGDKLNLPKGTPIPHSTIVSHWENRQKDMTPKDKALIGLMNNSDLGLCSAFISGKGRGVVAKKEFDVDDFVIEYKGNLMTKKEGLLKEKEYSRMNISESYMFFFGENCIDATAETKDLGRLINHSKKYANVEPLCVTLDGRPRLALIASKKIRINDEILFDYNDNRKSAVENFPFLKE